MDALIAVFITVGVIIALTVFMAIIDVIDWDIVMLWGCSFVFLIVPTPLMIVGVVGTNQGIMIVSEVLTCIASVSVGLQSSSSRNWIDFIPLLPTIIFLIVCVASNIVVSTVILAIVGVMQFAAATNK